MLKQFLLFVSLTASFMASSQSTSAFTDTLIGERVIQIVSKSGLIMNKVKKNQTAKVFLYNQPEPLKGQLLIHTTDSLKIGADIFAVKDIELLKLHSENKTIGGIVLMVAGAGVIAGGVRLLNNNSTDGFIQTIGVFAGTAFIISGTAVATIGTFLTVGSFKKFKADKWNFSVALK